MVTAKTLLYKALDYDGFWSYSKKQRNTEPSKVRKLQLDCLLATFQISKKNAKSITQAPPRRNDKNIITKSYYSTSKSHKSLGRLDYIKTLSDLQYLTHGEFLGDIDRAKYKDSLTDIISVVKTTFPDQMKNIHEDSINLVRLFRSLYIFRYSAYHTFESSLSNQPRKDFLVEEEYSQHLKQVIIKNLPNHFSEIDEALCTFIDPERRSFSEKEIQYPEFDLEAIDLNWWQNLSQ